MEAAPSVPFHERAPDLMTEEDLQSNQLEADESVNRLQAAHWQLPRDSKESLPTGKADRADLAFGVPTGRAVRAGPAYGVSPGQAERANLASGTPAERAGVPFSTLAERAQKGETSYGLQDASAYGELTSSDTQKRKEKKKRKDYAFQHQFSEKPSVISGCPGTSSDTQNRLPLYTDRLECMLHGSWGV